MRRLVLAAAAAALMPLAPASAAQAVEQGAYTIARSQVLSIPAADGHAYRVMVAWPDGPPPSQGWPVLTVLDGEDNFALVVQTLRRLGKAGARSGVAEGLVVAIESGDLPRRVYDYTPATPGWSIPAGAPAAGLRTCGGDAFLDFVAERLRPELARRWKIDPRRQALLGHSFGGLLGLHASLTRPALFDTVVAVSPSLWFGKDLLAREAAAVVPTAPRRLMIASGDERTPATGSVTATDLTAKLNARAGEGTAKVLTLPGQSHGSTMLAALVPALTFVFRTPP